MDLQTIINKAHQEWKKNPQKAKEKLIRLYNSINSLVSLSSIDEPACGIITDSYMSKMVEITDVRYKIIAEKMIDLNLSQLN